MLTGLIVFLGLMGQFCIVYAGEVTGVFDMLLNMHYDACLESESECPRSAPRYPREAGSLPEEIYSKLPGESELKSTPKFCCGYCNCSLDCFKYGSCCLSMYMNLGHGRNTIENTRYDCVAPEYLTTIRTKLIKSEWMVTKCPAAWQNNTIKELCENPGKDGTFDTMVPVTTKYPYTHYRNKFCAFCNGFDKSLSMSTWLLEINCEKLLTLPDKHLLDSLEDKQCNIVYKPPGKVPVQDCRKIPFSISTCNVTGKWNYYDEMIERGCLSFIDPFNSTYMNYFCYLCNTAETSPANPLICTLPQIDNIEDVVPPFSAIMNLDVINNMMQDTNLDCKTNTQFEDNKLMLCRDVNCHEGRYLDGDICLIDPNYSDRHCYQLFIKLTPRDFESTLFVHVVQDSSFHLSVLGRLALTIQNFHEQVTRVEIFYKRNILNPMNTVDYLIVQITLIPDVETNSDILNDFVYKTHERIIGIFIGNEDKQLYAELVVYNTTTIRNGISSDFATTTSDVLVNIYNMTFSVEHNNTCLHTETITFRHLHVCPYIKISFNEIAMKIENNILHITEKNLENVSFSQWKYEINDDNVFICKKDYMSFYEMLPSYQLLSEMSATQVTPKHLLALVCVCLSVCCLLVTIATYIFLYNIQSQPGINNIILCMFLVMAQLMYQFGAGQSSLSKWACVLIGALCHFLWLSVMFSMNICCIQMFLIFRSPTKSPSGLYFKVTLRYLLYIIILALVFVGINLIVSLQDSSGSETGYGGTICFISSSVMHLATFIIPSAVAISANIILFAYVVFTISQSSVNSINVNQDRNYFGAYARLSSLTGLTWILGYLYIFLKNETLEYIFIICNASQGVFILIAFVLNRRTYKMLCRGKYLNNAPVQNTKDLHVPDNGEMNISETRGIKSKDIICEK